MINANIIGEIEDLTEVFCAVQDAQEDMEIIINSPGGSAFEAIQLVNAIEKCPHEVTAKVEVQAMSAAAVIALGCSHVKLDEKAIVMLHNCWSIAIGNAKDMEQQAQAMKAVDNALQVIVTQHCNEENAAYVRSKMEDGELWLTGKQAAELFDNVELVEAPKKEGLMAAAGSLADLVAHMQDLETKLAELKAEDKEIEEEEKKEEPETVEPEEEKESEEKKEPEEVPEEEEKEEPKAEYCAEVYAIINEVL